MNEAIAPGSLMPFLQDLPLRILAVVHQLIGVLRPIELAHLAENADLAEQALHAEGAALVGHDRHDALADRPCRAAASSGCARTPWWSKSRGPRRSRFSSASKADKRRNFERRRGAPARRQRAAERGAALAQIFHLLAVFGQAQERHLGEIARRRSGMLKRSRNAFSASSPIFLADGRSSGLRPPRPCRSP